MVSTPMTINPTPAIRFSASAPTQFEIAAPAKTLSAVTAINAQDAAIKTISLLLLSLLAKSMVASWVLSPSSAKKIDPNTVRKNPQFIFDIPCLEFDSSIYCQGRSDLFPMSINLNR